MTGFILSVLLGFVPMFMLAGIIYWLDRYEKEPGLLLGGVFFWGAVVAVIGALITQIALGQSVLAVTGSAAIEEAITSSLAAPVTEEVFKGIAVLLVYLFFRREFDSVLDGIVYAAITALGFAATEDVLYYYGAYLDGGTGSLATLFFLRFIIFGWQHAFFTAFTGIGLAVSRLSRDWLIKITAPIAGLAIAVFVHSLHNSLLTFLAGFGGLVMAVVVAWLGWFVMGGLILWLIFREKAWLGEYLQEEVALGTLSDAHFQRLRSFFGQTAGRYRALFNGRWSVTNQFYQQCAELAHKKRQLAQMGDEDGNGIIIDQLRARIKQFQLD